MILPAANGLTKPATFDIEFIIAIPIAADLPVRNDVIPQNPGKTHIIPVVASDRKSRERIVLFIKSTLRNNPQNPSRPGITTWYLFL